MNSRSLYFIAGNYKNKMAKLKKIHQKIEDTFMAKLEEKTSWGKEELKKMYMKVKSDVLMEEVDKEEDKKE